MPSNKKSASKLALAMTQAKVSANDLQDRIGPAVEDARERLTPMVADARERLAPVVEDARDRLTPVVGDARERLADLAGTVAVRLDETLPDKATPVAVTEAAAAQRSSERSGRLKALLMLAGIGAAAAFVARKLRGGGGEPRWQSTPPGRPTSASAPKSTEQVAESGSAPAAAVAGMAAADASTDPAEATANDRAGGSPDEVAADATETPRTPTTPEAPAEKIEIVE